MNDIHRILRGRTIKDHIEELGQFRIEIFREYPYLYEGDMVYERKYLGRYLRNPESILVIIHDEKGIKGACTAIPLMAEDEEIKQPFREDPADGIFYIGELMVRADSRQRGYGSGLLATTLQLIEPAQYPTICLYTVDRGEAHPLRPAAYHPPDLLWRKFGFEKDLSKMAYYRWKDLGAEDETEKPMNVWVRKK